MSLVQYISREDFCMNKNSISTVFSTVEQYGSVEVDHLTLRVVKRSKKTVYFDWEKIKTTLARCSYGIEGQLDKELIFKEVIRNVFDGVSTPDLEKALVLSVAAFIAKDPAYDILATRIFL